MHAHRSKISPLAGTAALLIWLTVALTLDPGCAASQRAETLQTAQIAITTAANGMILYEGPHEVELARTGTPDQAAAALKAFRAKRAKFNLALNAAADAIIIAYKLNDQPSADGLVRAIAEVARDYLDLKGITP